MADKRMIFTGEKESFIVRVLIQKAQGAGIECEFVPCTVDDINSKWDEAGLVVLYIDENTRPKEDVLHFLADGMEEKGSRLMVIGNREDINFVCDQVPGEYIYKTAARPVDNAKYVASLTEYFERAEAGEFRKSILIVDDDPQYLTLVRQWLRGTYKVYMANSGLQAIKLLGKNKVDLILLDHEMPVTSGPQVLEMLRSDEETKSIPVMFLTGKSDRASVMEVVSLKPEGYFLKTIQREALLEKLKGFFVLQKKD